MDMTQQVSKKSRGQQLLIAERNVIISKMIDILCEGYTSTNAISKRLRIARGTVELYRPLVDEIIRKTKIDRNVVRNLQVRRTYELIEMLMNDLKATNKVAERAQLYNQIYKFSSHLAQITGINVETHVNIDHQKLVIIRSNTTKKPKKPIIDAAIEATEVDA